MIEGKTPLEEDLDAALPTDYRISRLEVKVKELENVVVALCRFVTYITPSHQWPTAVADTVREYSNKQQDTDCCEARRQSREPVRVCYLR